VAFVAPKEPFSNAHFVLVGGHCHNFYCLLAAMAYEMDVGVLVAASRVEAEARSGFLDGNPVAEDSIAKNTERLEEAARLNSLARCISAGFDADAAQPNLEAMNEHAIATLNAADAVLSKLMKKHIDILKHTHFLLIALAGAEMRKELTGMKQSEQYTLIMHSYLRWSKCYTGYLYKPPHDPFMYHKPTDFPQDLWELALLIPGGKVLTLASVHRKYLEDVMASFNNFYGVVWSWAPIGSGKVKWEKIEKMRADVITMFSDKRTFSMKSWMA
jgi:hypothetical protein